MPGAFEQARYAASDKGAHSGTPDPPRSIRWIRALCDEPYPFASHTRASTALLILLDDVAHVVAPAARFRRYNVPSDSVPPVPAGQTRSGPLTAGGSAVSSAPKKLVRLVSLAHVGQRTTRPCKPKSPSKAQAVRIREPGS